MRMSHIDPIPMSPAAAAAIGVIALLIGMGAPAARAADKTGFGFEEERVEFRNRGVTLAGSLLLPSSGEPHPAVVFVHGAGRQTRESYREVGKVFARRGIAALIYDKRGTGRSGGAYESREPHENLVNDALSAVAFLKQRPEIAASQVGIWGLSQGAYISAAAASRSADIRFIIAVGTSAADGTQFYYRDNLFRRYELSDTLRDVAEKAQLAQDTLPHNLRDESLFASFSPRAYPPPDKYMHPAWSRVKQPVLAMWGQLDQHVPVGESAAGLKNSLARANNENWTIVILPGANHDLGISETGELHRKWRGYAPGALKTMTDWAWRAIDHPTEIGKTSVEGVAARDAGVLPRLARYERLRWYGNGTVQAALWIAFLTSFLTNTIAGVRWCLTRWFRLRHSVASPASNRFVNLKRAIGALNLLILIAFSIAVWLVLDQLRPSCPTVLSFLPLLGAVSTLSTVALLFVLIRTRFDRDWTTARKVRCSLEVLCLILFVPYMFYWNLIGYRF